MNKIKIILLMLLCLFAYSASAQQLSKIPLNENDLFIVSTYLDKKKISSSIDIYLYDEKLFLAIEPLFNALNLKYQLTDEKLTVWKNEDSFELDFLSKEGMSSDGYWANDGYYQFVDQKTLETLFDITFDFTMSKLSLLIKEGSFKFPITVIDEQAKTRFLQKSFTSLNQQYDINQTPITIKDEYRLFTFPHGEIYSSVNLNNNSEQGKINAQLVSDLLYHSARLNISKNDSDKVKGGITFSRYKTSPNDNILGAFDRYSFGDISSYTGGGILPSASGVGINISRTPDNYRRNNTEISLEQYAKPGWEAELFNNSRFVAAQKVPETGLLIFENVQILYGENNFEIKLYGPYGEEEVILRSYSLKQNPLQGGEMAYGLYALDANRTVFNNSNTNKGLSLSDVGAVFDYGINDRWQLGLTLSDIDGQRFNSLPNGRTQMMSIKNYLSFPRFLVENEFAILGDSNNFAQATSISGRLFSTSTYQLQYESSKGLMNTFATPQEQDETSHTLSAGFFDTLYDIPLQFRLTYYKFGDYQVKTFSNNLAYNVKKIRFSNTLSYSEIESDYINNQLLTGSLGVSGEFFKDFRISAFLNYDLDAKQDQDTILDSSFVSAQYKLTDPLNLKHYFTATYKPLIDNVKQTSSWELSHRLSFETQQYRLSLQSAYSENNDWSFRLNFNFYLGYDYHNNNILMSSEYQSQSANLSVHTYLDRQLNGIPDVLDYNLEGVTFSGKSEWANLTSGKSGKTILPGVPVTQTFSFRANWLEGTETINQGYTIYTHPGARVDVNMPFYLSTELAGFVYQDIEKGQLPVSRLVIELLDEKNVAIQTQVTDQDGYYEFLNMQPNEYTIRINAESLKSKSLTSDIIGYTLTTPNSGGFSELPTFNLRRIKNEADMDKLLTIPYSIGEDETEILLPKVDVEQEKNLFTLPPKDKIKKVRSLGQETAEEENQPSTTNINSVVIDQEFSNKQESTKQLNQRTQNFSDTEHFTLQLGAYREQKEAEKLVTKYSYLTKKPKLITTKSKSGQEIYRVYSGQFSNEIEAKKYANRNQLKLDDFFVKTTNILLYGRVTEKLTTFDNNKWVIQLMASKEEISQQDIDKLPNSLGLHLTRKNLASGESLYCIVTDEFNSKKEALMSITEANIDGWVTKTDNYSLLKKL